MDIFARITKVDERTRTVTGRAAQEVLDRSGEIMDYAKSKPEFMKWSAECFADSGGKSHGNVREMHSNVAAGKLTALTFVDDEHAIDVEAQIVDDQSWEKVTSGVFTGFSIGGSYKSKKQEVLGDQMVTRYVAAPSEISLVDRPCIPTAKFDFTKRDGTVMQKQFQTQRPVFELRSNGKLGLTKNAQLDPFRKIHAVGRQQLSGDFLYKFTQPGTDDGQRQANNLMQKRVRVAPDGWQLRKVGFPPQSSNGVNGGAIADTTGATNNWHDQTWSPPKPTVIGGQVVTDVSHSPNIKAVLDALKQDMSKPKRLSV